MTITAAEVFEEVDWFLACGVDPTHIASALGRTIPALAVLARRNDREDLARLFGAEESRGRRR